MYKVVQRNFGESTNDSNGDKDENFPDMLETGLNQLESQGWTLIQLVRVTQKVVIGIFHKP